MKGNVCVQINAPLAFLVQWEPDENGGFAIEAWDTSGNAIARFWLEPQQMKELGEDIMLALKAKTASDERMLGVA